MTSFPIILFFLLLIINKRLLSEKVFVTELIIDNENLKRYYFVFQYSKEKMFVAMFSVFVSDTLIRG